VSPASGLTYPQTGRSLTVIFPIGAPVHLRRRSRDSRRMRPCVRTETGGELTRGKQPRTEQHQSQVHRPEHRSHSGIHAQPVDHGPEVGKIAVCDTSACTLGLKLHADVSQTAILGDPVHYDLGIWRCSATFGYKTPHPAVHDRCLWKYRSGYRTRTSTNSDHGNRRWLPGLQPDI